MPTTPQTRERRHHNRSLEEAHNTHVAQMIIADLDGALRYFLSALKTGAYPLDVSVELDSAAEVCRRRGNIVEGQVEELRRRLFQFGYSV